MDTRVPGLFGIEHPVIQGGMAWVADGRLAGAVSAAGGLGVVACGAAPLSWIEEQVAIARSLAPGAAVGANVMLMNPDVESIADLLVRLRVDVVTTGAGSPARFIERWKEAGIKVVPVVAQAALAARMERLGADAVIAEGCEAGGHIGEMSTMALVPQVCDAVSIPVIAAGGIADARGAAAARVLGAEGVQVGTRFLTVEECRVAEVYKDKVLRAKDSDTIVTGRVTGHPVRGLKNAWSRSMKSLERGVSDPHELEGMYAGSLRRAVEGDAEGGSFMAGQVAGLVKARGCAADVVSELSEGFAAGEASACAAASLLAGVREGGERRG
ncbi:MAG: nitronate monooxygenase [Slackia sp.]|nr:nitronate monooxygenase [Slackia sp.]